MTLPRTSAIRHALREWLRLIGWALANSGPPLHQQASMQYWTSFEENRDAA